MAEVILKEICKQYDNGIFAAKDISLTIRDKEFMVLVGPSGCGKSTTLRMIAGLEPITSGNLYIDGERMNDVQPKDRDIAMVFQNYALYPHMTVYENMAFGLQLRKFSKEEIRHRVYEAAEILGLTEYLERKPKALSGGQRQRVAVGRAIVRKPKVFLFDEPLSNLDAKMRVQMRTEISRLHKKLEATMIYVTHDQVEAMTMGDRITVMKDGLIQQTEAPLELYHHPVNRFVAGFIGSPAMNFIEGIISRSEGKILFSEANGPLQLELPESYSGLAELSDDGVILAGIRPEDIHMTRNGNECLVWGKALVEVCEPMGNEVFAHLTTATGNLKGHSLISRSYLETIPRHGTVADIGFDCRKFHFFDQKTGVSLANLVMQES